MFEQQPLSQFKGPSQYMSAEILPTGRTNPRSSWQPTPTGRCPPSSTETLQCSRAAPSCTTSSTTMTLTGINFYKFIAFKFKFGLNSVQTKFLCWFEVKTLQVTPRALGDKRDKEFSAALYKLSFYASGTVDNLFATSSPIQGSPIILLHCIERAQEHKLLLKEINICISFGGL